MFDLAVVGGGSGGFGAALAAARRGLSVILIEAGPTLGGTSTLAGVNTWEPGLAGPGFPAELYRRLREQPQTIAVSRTVKFYSPAEPWGYSRPDPTLDYRASLRRAGRSPGQWARVTFEPAAMAAAMTELLADTGQVEVRLGARCVAAATAGRRVERLELVEPAGHSAVTARFVIDATAQLHVARAAGCATYLGAEPRALYGEPAAPEEHRDELNGVSLCWRITPVAEPAVEPLPADVPAEPLLPPISMTEYPSGDVNLNPLPVMDGHEHHRLPPEAARAECERRVRRIWWTLQTRHGFDRYRLREIFPLTGVREGPRLIGRRVLTEIDLRAGCAGQDQPERWIALADHALDTHGRGHRINELTGPYGVPYDCLLPVEFDNLAVACRGASFSHLAASSCRLSRTMMQLGHAAGLAAALAVRDGVGLPEVDPTALRAWLTEDDVSLDPRDPRWP